MILRLLQSDLVLYLLPLPVVVIAIVVASLLIKRNRPEDVPRAISLTVPLPLAAGYFLVFGLAAKSWGDWLGLTGFFAPQAYVLALTGSCLLIAVVRGREISIAGPAWITVVGLVGHLWTVEMLSGVS